MQRTVQLSAGTVDGICGLVGNECLSSNFFPCMQMERARVQTAQSRALPSQRSCLVKWSKRMFW